MSEHSNPRWYFGASSDDKRIIVDGKGLYVASVQIHQTPRSAGQWDEDRRNANASLIVRSVNSHDKLVEALEAWSEYMRELDAPAPDLGLRAALKNEAMRLTRSALASAKGTTG